MKPKINRVSQWLVLLFVGISGGVSSFAAPYSPQKSVHTQPHSNESAEEFRARYNIQSKDLVIERVEVNSALARADGPILYRIKAKVLKPGRYIFTFENRANYEAAFEIRKVTLVVKEEREGIDESLRIAIVSPQEPTWKTYSSGRAWGRLGNPLLITWSYNPGGEGIPNGWFLSSIEGGSTKVMPKQPDK